MRLTNVVKTWLAEQEWKEEPEINEEKQTSSTEFGYSLDDFSVKGFLEASEKLEVFKLYFYFLDAKVPEKRLDEAQKLVNAVSNSMLVGSLQLLRNDRVIRFYGAIDVEDATFDPAHITNLLRAGLGTMKDALPRYMAVCFGGKTAEQTLTDEAEAD